MGRVGSLPRGKLTRSPRFAGHRSACASLVAWCGAGVAVRDAGGRPPTGVLIATSRRDAPRCGAFADERRQTRRGSRFSSGFARLERERMMPSSHSARSSPPSVGATPAHCGAFAISGASRPAMTADGCTSFCKELRDGFGVRAPVGRVAANGSRFPPFDPIREAGAQN